MNDELFDETLEAIDALPSTGSMFLYILYAEGTRWIKIGYATDVEFRRYQLQTGCPPPLRILFSTPTEHAQALEEMLKAYLAPYSLQGEWFTLPNDVPTVLELLAFIFKQSQPVQPYIGPLSRLQKLSTAETRVIQALREHDYLSIRPLMEAIGASSSQYNYLRRLLSNLANRGIVGKFGYGKYCLADKVPQKEGL
jgi:hypothetical protein